LFVAGCLGLGAGPLMSSLATALANLVPCHLDGFEGMLAFVALLPWMQLSVLLRPLPSLEQLAACRAQGQASRAQAVVVCLCLAMLVLRNLSLASLEVGTAELFQKKYHFPPVAVGFFCALIVFTALPVQLFYERLQGQISLHSMLWASFAAGCFLMLESFSALFTASMLFFPMMALSSGIVMAKMQEYVMPDGSLLDRNTTTLLGLVMADFLGRGWGPISARYGIYLGGQKGFALTQVAYAALSLVLFLVSEIASKKARKDTSESSDQSKSEESSKGD